MEASKGPVIRDIKTLDDPFVHTLQDIYSAGNQTTKALPKLIDEATHPDLKQGFETRLRQTKTQIRRLEKVFQMTGHSPMTVTCAAINGIIEEAGEIADQDALDAPLMASAQTVERDEITRCGAPIAWAKCLGQAPGTGGLCRRAPADPRRRRRPPPPAHRHGGASGQPARPGSDPGARKALR